jgi:DOPA 4,5-dioxygenase
MLIQAPSYHAHIYFRDEEVDAATALHGRAEAALGTVATVWPMRKRCVGPHARPMFEIEFPHAARAQVLAWVEAHHGGFSVLLHPETGDELSDHRDHAVWLGAQLPLDLSILS